MYLTQKTENKFLFQVLSLIKLIDGRLHISFLISFKDMEVEEEAVDVGGLMITIFTNHLENTHLETYGKIAEKPLFVEMYTVSGFV